MEELNLKPIIKVGLKLYSTIFGNGIVNYISEHGFFIKFTDNNEDKCISYNYNGKYIADRGEVTIFPSKNNKSWKPLDWNIGDILYDNKKMCYYKISSIESNKIICNTILNPTSKNLITHIKCIYNFSSVHNLELCNEFKPAFELYDKIYAFYKNEDIVNIKSNHSEFKKAIITNVSFKKVTFKYPLKNEELFEDYELITDITDINTAYNFKTYDKVWVRNSIYDTWKPNIYLDKDINKQYPYRCIDGSYKYCIPFDNLLK